MQVILYALDSVLAALRVGFLIAAAALAVVCGVDWMVRTRRLSPFSAVARFMRNSVDPLMRPIERRVVRSGGLPSSAPWWALGSVVLGGIVLFALLDFVRTQVAFAFFSLNGGPGAIARLLITWAFGVLQVALIVRVLLSWIPLRPGAWWWRWSYAITEPMLKPLRRIIPPFAAMDVTPIIAWFLLSALQGFFLRMA